MSTTPISVFSEHELDTFKSVRETRDSLSQTRTRLRELEERVDKSNIAASIAQRELADCKESAAKYEQKLVDLRSTVLMLFGSKSEPGVSIVTDSEDIGSRAR